jgi:O-antigen/teichoic acid export membrane protein
VCIGRRRKQCAGATRRSNSIARASGRSFVFILMTTGCEFLIALVTARGYGAEGRGLYALASTAAMLIVTVLGGVSAALAREIAHRRTTPGGIYAAATLIAAFGGTVILLAAFTARAIVGSSDSMNVIAIGAVAATFILLGVYQLTIFNAEDRIALMLNLDLANVLIPLAALVVAVIVWPDDAVIGIAAWAAAHAVVPLATIGIQWHLQRFSTTGIRALVRRLLIAGAPVSLANGVMRLFYRVDVLILAAFRPLGDVGRYSIAVAGAESLFVLSRAVATAAFARQVGKDTTEEEAVGLTARTVRHSVLLLAGGAVVVVPLTWALAGPIFGDAFDTVWQPLLLLVPGVIFLAIAEVLRQWFVVRHERAREYLIMAAMGTVVNGGLAIALVPSLGAEGAALATTASYLCAGGYLALRFAQRSGLGSPARLLPGPAEVRDYTGVMRKVLGRPAAGGGAPPEAP